MAATLTTEFLKWTFRPDSQSVEKTIAIVEVTLDTYVDNGLVVDFTSLSNFDSVDMATVLSHDTGDAALGLVCEYDLDNHKIRFFDCGADGDYMDEIATDDLSAVKCIMMVIGQL